MKGFLYDHRYPDGEGGSQPMTDVFAAMAEIHPDAPVLWDVGGAVVPPEATRFVVGLWNPLSGNPGLGCVRFWNDALLIVDRTFVDERAGWRDSMSTACDRCAGDGTVEVYPWVDETCPTCNGSGKRGQP